MPRIWSSHRPFQLLVHRMGCPFLRLYWTFSTSWLAKYCEWFKKYFANLNSMITLRSLLSHQRMFQKEDLLKTLAHGSVSFQNLNGLYWQIHFADEFGCHIFGKILPLNCCMIIFKMFLHSKFNDFVGIPLTYTIRILQKRGCIKKVSIIIFGLSMQLSGLYYADFISAFTAPPGGGVVQRMTDFSSHPLLCMPNLFAFSDSFGWAIFFFFCQMQVHRSIIPFLPTIAGSR